MGQGPDQNDILVNTYSVDFVGIFRVLLDWVTGHNADVFLQFLSQLWNIYSVIAIFLSLLFFLGFVYAKIRLTQLIELENEHLIEAEEAWAHTYGGAASKSTKWDQISEHIAGDNPVEWRLAIIEADILLEEVLTNAGYVGATIGDKLKTANVASFATLQDAWEAHKIRNQIAHDGSDFVLTKRIAQETIVRYERVFREFGAI